LLARGSTRLAAVETLKTMKPGFPPALLTALRDLKATDGAMPTVRELTIRELAPGMILEQDLVSLKGIRLVPAGQEITRTLMIKLASVAEGVGVAEPFRVRVPT